MNKVKILRVIVISLSYPSSVIENEKYIVDHTISVITTLLLTTNNEVEHDAYCTIANISELIEIHANILE